MIAGHYTEATLQRRITIKFLTAPDHTAPDSHGDFLPDLCNLQAVFTLIVVGELLAFALVIAGDGLKGFTWLRFGMVSFIILWITLCSAALLCVLRPWLNRRNSILAGTVSYAVVLLLTVFFSTVGSWMQGTTQSLESDLIFSNLIVAAIFAGVALRHFYLQQQLRNQQQAELNSRIQALQSRIRPHFLFNSMNSIASLIEVDPKAAERLVVDLAHLFRASLGSPGLVPLQDEITLCERFIDMEQLRLSHRLKVDWHTQGDFQNQTVPSLLLQPLVENAIYHGIQPRAGGGVVKIGVTVDDHQVTLSVTNPTNGLSNESNSLPLSAEKAGNGIALDNIRHRLTAHYGSRASLRISREKDEFNVIVRYPSSTPKISA